MTDHEDPPKVALVPLLSRRDMMDATKEAVKELITEQVTTFGWWSLKTVAIGVLGGGLVLWLYVKGWSR